MWGSLQLGSYFYPRNCLHEIPSKFPLAQALGFLILRKSIRWSFCILAYAGVESSASHVKDMDNPGKNYPKAILILVVATILLDTLGGATVAATIPQNQLSLDTGVIQAYSYLIHHFWRGMAGSFDCRGHLFRCYCRNCCLGSWPIDGDA